MEPYDWIQKVALIQSQMLGVKSPWSELHASQAAFTKAMEDTKIFNDQIKEAFRKSAEFTESISKAGTMAAAISQVYQPFSKLVLKLPPEINIPGIGGLNKFFNSPEYSKLKFLEFDLVGDLEYESEQIVFKESERVKSIISDIYHNNDILYKIEPRHFEEVIAELLNKRNFKVELTKQTRDGGYDILAIQEIGGYPIKFLVECKRYAAKNPVEIDIVRSFMDVIKEEQANAGIIVTTSYFTSGVHNRQNKHPYLLHLNDRVDVLDWVQQYKLGLI
ncbi:restriction endonuclease [Adhaeribacter pallidiroseus]|uniref:Restriction endonuclease type IV Mrr domain-containing protein n=1 Tax=Adhaeribacter pallidiroseus TaxID=2072847 RepID=A0A369QJC4_9BACT|nr:restriction endonuclease [Adhaeribacter pallidiroseus]RDC65033.1 uncharacterized protein AHMF7616_03656 [Adhaeribacter pallidiroseus]